MSFLKLQNDRFLNYSFWAVIISLPLPMIVNNIAIILFSFFSLKSLKNKRFKFDLPSALLPVLFTLAFISIIYSRNKYDAFKGVEKILPLLLFYFSIPLSCFSKETIYKFLKGFAIINVIIILLCVGVAIFKVIDNNSFIVYNPENFVNENYFLYHRFSSSIGFHAVYLAIYSVFSSCVLIYDLKNHNRNTSNYVMLFVLLLGILLLKSFAVIASYFVILLTYFACFKQFNLVKFRIVILLFILLSASGLFYYKAKGMDQKIFNYNFQDNVHNPNWNSLNIRLAKWECALEVFKANKLIGVGVGSGQAELNKKYLEKKFEIGFKNNFSTHNQYLHYLVELGLIGCLVFVIGIILNLVISLKNKNFLLFALMVLLSICSITENVLTLNKGIVFFSLFYFLTYNLKEPRTNKL